MHEQYLKVEPRSVRPTIALYKPKSARRALGFGSAIMCPYHYATF
jgi:hypothetical protein